jgi:hypothetical protein
MPNNKFITLLNSDYLSLEKTIKSYLKDYTRIQDFLQSLFQAIPLEFFIILGFSVLLLLILNSVSPKSRQFHLLLSVLISLGICVYASSKVLHKMKDIREVHFLYSAIAIVIIGYSWALLVYVVTYARKQYLKSKLTSPATIEQSVFNLHSSYNDAMMQLHLLLANKNVDLADIRDKLIGLRLSTEGMMILLETQKKKQEIEDKQSPIELHGA